MELESPEIEVLLSICKEKSAEQISNNLGRQLDAIDWKLLIEVACIHGVEGLVCRAVSELPPEQVTETISNAAHAYIDQCAEQNQNHADQLSYILSELEREGIPAIPFKGPTLAVKAYGDLKLRSFFDLDFLIKHDQVDQAISVLNELGYAHDRAFTPKQWRSFVRYAGQDVLFGPGVPIEPHWEFSPRTWSLDLDYSGLWSRISSVTFNDGAVLSLATEDEFILLCIHGNKEQWRKLKWVVDLAWYLNRNNVDWEIVCERAEQQGVARMVRVAIILASRLVELPVPERVFSWVEKDHYSTVFGERLSIVFFQKDTTQEDIYSLSAFYWKMRERYSDRWRYIYRTVTQPRVRHFFYISLPDSLFYLYFPYKILHDYFLLPIWIGLKAAGLVKRRDSNQERM